jgi:hypothetical protein
MSRWFASSATALATAVVEPVASAFSVVAAAAAAAAVLLGAMVVPSTGEDKDEGRGKGSKQMMHCSGSFMTPVSTVRRN